MDEVCKLKEEYSLRELSINYALDIISGKWKLPILWEISRHESIRFNQLQKNLDGISSLMLTRSLKELVDKKLISRIQYNEVPPHVEYSVTELGKGLCPILHAIEDWGKALVEAQKEN
ncbi:winged helix-turn-helix transcriptional regulator [Clostridium sp.]|uniref:winged helix-turn-helix transcriptional regulator n=1 Tax=Clostridium sp. TaxID=1506 RepID=UPI0039967195